MFNPLGWLKSVWSSSTALYNASYEILAEKWGFERQGDIVTPLRLLEVEQKLKELSEKYSYGRHAVLNNEKFWDDFENLISTALLYIELNRVGRDVFSTLHIVSAIQISALVRLLNRYVYKVEGIEIIAGEKVIDIPSTEEEKEEYKKKELSDIQNENNEEDVPEPIPEEGG